jgi:3-methyladenine DNA glycosylase/8-oxoguanine DNA glycosylase
MDRTLLESNPHQVIEGMTIAALATAMAEGRIELGPHVDPERARRELEVIKGIGPWTAGYITMRALSDPNGWPHHDLALRRSLGCSAAELEQRATRWQPWRAYAALLVWRSDPTQQPKNHAEANGARR